MVSLMQALASRLPCLGSLDHKPCTGNTSTRRCGGVSSTEAALGPTARESKWALDHLACQAAASARDEGPGEASETSTGVDYGSSIVAENP